jgi:hypothetical protein
MSIPPPPEFRIVPYVEALTGDPGANRVGTAISLGGPADQCDDSLKCLDGLGPVWGFHVQNAGRLNLGALYRFRTLKYLSVDGRGATIDCSLFPELEWLIADWSSSITFPGELSRLRRLRIYSISETDLTHLPSWKNLEAIEIVSSMVRSLNGLVRWKALRAVSCLKLPLLSDLRELGRCERLESLYFESCREIKNIEHVAQCGMLKKLVMNRCGVITSIAGLERLPLLEEVRLVRTYVEDGNVLPLVNVEVAVFDRRPHYSHSEKEIAALRRSRS